MKHHPLKKILILVAILAVPGFLYYLLQEKGKNRYRPLAIYGEKTVAKTFHSVRGKQIPDTIYHQIDGFNLTNQQGKSVSWSTYSGKVVLLNLFYTSGKNFGVDYANKAMSGFANLYEKNKMMHFISLSIDPVNDTPEILAGYAKRLQANSLKWDLLTGDSTVVSNLVKEGLLLDALKTTKNGEPNFTYSNMFVLIDTHHKIRGFYEATNQEALSKLDDEIKVLIAEELRNMRDGR